MKKKSMDLTQGNIVTQIILFAAPILLGQLFQNLYNSVDSIVVGQCVGTTALAAVSSSADISQMIIGFFTGLSTGSGVLFSRYFGAKDQDKLHKSIHTALSFAVILGTFMACLGIMISPTLLRALSCPPDVFAEATAYLRIYLFGVLFTAIYNVESGILRSVGDSRHPFEYLVISSCTNIVLDVLFVAVFKMGVSGVAYATIIAQLLSVVLCTKNLMSTSDVYKVEIKDLKIDFNILKDVMGLGLPAAIQTCLIALSNLFLTKYVNEFGSAAMAGVGSAKKIDKYAGMISQSLGLSITTFISQNVGAKKYDRAFRSLRTVLVMGFITVACMGIPIYFNAELFVRLFSKDPAAIAYGVQMVHVFMPFFYLQTVHQVMQNAVRGFGKSFVVMCTSIFSLILCRQTFLYLMMQHNHVITNVFYSYPFAWTLSAILTTTYYFIKIYIPYKHGIMPEGKKK